MTDDELNEIEARQCATDVPALVAEVRRLRAELGTQKSIPPEVLKAADRLQVDDGNLTPEHAAQIWKDLELLARFGLGVVQHGRVFGPLPADEETQA